MAWCRLASRSAPSIRATIPILLPRLGLAWDITGKGTTVLRAGYSIIYSSLIPMQAFTGIGGGQNGTNGGVATVPTGATHRGERRIDARTRQDCNRERHRSGWPGSPLAFNWQNNGPTQPIFSGANAVECGDGSNDAAGNPTSPCNLAVTDHNFRDPYVQNWTLGVQHAFTRIFPWMFPTSAAMAQG